MSISFWPTLEQTVSASRDETTNQIINTQFSKILQLFLNLKFRSTHLFAFDPQVKDPLF